ncbi:hypothetical protein TNIN_366141 [Trichonephila inaurata madagascariensis]|uniref:Uncharacterized protein n=1 Tax=Trichonephila inaurata madagascariensis TaxID=2747483 RepID=A0A8X6IUJ8_9ARAC|nr:hypothetical protein TNIN_366141 [Trichonephila inaurata madagascariensis]
MGKYRVLKPVYRNRKVSHVQHLQERNSKLGETKDKTTNIFSRSRTVTLNPAIVDKQGNTSLWGLARHLLIHMDYDFFELECFRFLNKRDFMHLEFLKVNCYFTRRNGTVTCSVEKGGMLPGATFEKDMANENTSKGNCVGLSNFVQ